MYLASLVDPAAQVKASKVVASVAVLVVRLPDASVHSWRKVTVTLLVVIGVFLQVPSAFTPST